MVDVGDVAPDFTLKNQHGEEISLSSLRGTPVVLVFFPFAFSGICAGEFAEIRDRMTELDGAQVLAISPATTSSPTERLPTRRDSSSRS